MHLYMQLVGTIPPAFPAALIQFWLHSLKQVHIPPIYPLPNPWWHLDPVRDKSSPSDCVAIIQPCHCFAAFGLRAWQACASSFPTCLVGGCCSRPLSCAGLRYVNRIPWASHEERQGIMVNLKDLTVSCFTETVQLQWWCHYSTTIKYLYQIFLFIHPLQFRQQLKQLVKQ